MFATKCKIEVTVPTESYRDWGMPEEDSDLKKQHRVLDVVIKKRPVMGQRRGGRATVNGLFQKQKQRACGGPIGQRRVYYGRRSGNRGGELKKKGGGDVKGGGQV